MPARTSVDQERRKQALRKRLALDFQPLRTTLSKGLELLVDPEAAVFCTATVEGFCNALFSIAIKQLAETPAARTGPSDTKITVFHLQVALRSHPELAELLQRAESARVALEFFLDDVTSRALYERKLIASREAKHLVGGSGASEHFEHEGEGDSGRRAQHRAEEEEELIRRHERTRSEWQKREDDPFSEVDFAMVLKCVHPAFTLSYNATTLLSALVRELLNEVCARADVDALQRRRHPPELLLEDLQSPLLEVFCGVATGKMAAFEVGAMPGVSAVGAQIARMASECLARYRLQSRRGKTLTLHFRVYQPGSSSALQPAHVLQDVARDTPFATLLAQMRSKCHLPVSVGLRGGTFSDTRGHGEFIAIYRAHQVEPSATPAALAMPTGAVVYLVARRWWDLTRRTEARRGLLSSQRPQDALVKSLVAGTESRVRKELRAAGVGVNALSSSEESLVKRGLNGSTSNSSLLAASNGHVGLAKSPSRLPATQDEDSLSVLLRERAAARREKERRPAASNNSSEDPDATRTSSRQHGLPVAQLAANSQQLVQTLDRAWLEFAQLTTSVRVAAERLEKWAHDADEVDEPPKLSVEQLQSLEDEWCARVHSTEALAAQTRAAHKLATRMLNQVRPRRALPRGGASSSSTT